MTNLDEEADGADLVISIVESKMETERVLLTRNDCVRTLGVQISGRFGDRNVDFGVKQTRSIDLRQYAPKSRMASDLTLIGQPILESFIRKIAKEPDGDCVMSIEQVENEPFFAEFNLRLIEEFDRRIGRDQDFIVIRWRVLQWFSRFVTVVVIIAFVTWFYHDTQAHEEKKGIQNPVKNRLGMSLLGGVMVGAPVWLFLFAATASSMPIEFFKRHASGQRVLKIVGCQDPAKGTLDPATGTANFYRDRDIPVVSIQGDGEPIARNTCAHGFRMRARNVDPDLL